MHGVWVQIRHAYNGDGTTADLNKMSAVIKMPPPTIKNNDYNIQSIYWPDALLVPVQEAELNAVRQEIVQYSKWQNTVDKRKSAISASLLLLLHSTLA